MGDHRAGTGPGPLRIPEGLPADAQRPARPGTDRPAVRRTDGRDRVRHRRLRAPPGEQAEGHPGPGREGPGHARRSRAPAAGGRRRHLQRRRRRALPRIRRADRHPGDPDPDGLGRNPRRPPADGRHGRPADLAPLRQRHPAGIRPGARHRQPLGQPPHRQRRGLYRRSPLHPCRHRTDPDRPGVHARPGHRLRRRRRPRRIPRSGPRVEGRRQAEVARRLAGKLPAAQTHAAAQDPLRQRAGETAARLRRDERVLRQGCLLRQHHRPVADRRRTVPPRLPTAPLDQLRLQAGPLGWTIPAALGWSRPT